MDDDSPAMEELAEQVGTIPYEVLYTISKRVLRVYISSDRPEVSAKA